MAAVVVVRHNSPLYPNEDFLMPFNWNARGSLERRISDGSYKRVGDGSIALCVWYAMERKYDDYRVIVGSTVYSRGDLMVLYERLDLPDDCVP
jgi:hypothetical protein